MIIRMVEKDMPARYDPVPLKLLDTCATHLARLAPKAAGNASNQVLYVNALWKRMLAMGAGRSPELVYNRLEAMNEMRQNDGFLATASSLYEGLQAAGDAEAETAVVPQIVVFYLRTGQFQSALLSLQGLTRIEYRSLALKAVRRLVFDTCLGSIPYASRRKLFSEVVRRVDPALLKRGRTTSYILRFLLEGGHSIEHACATLIQKEEDRNYYAVIVTNLVALNVPQLTGARFRAAVHVLEEYIPTHTHFSAVGYTQIWNSVIQSICKSDLAESERSALVQRSLACFPDTSETEYKHLFPLLRSIVVHCLARPDPFPELAAHAWSTLYDADQGMSICDEFDAAIRGFVAAGKADLAIQVVMRAGRNQKTHSALRSVLAARGDWTSHEFEHALHVSGLTGLEGELVAKFAHFGFAQSGYGDNLAAYFHQVWPGEVIQSVEDGSEMDDVVEMGDKGELEVD